MGIKSLLEEKKGKIARHFVSVKTLIDVLAKEQECSKSDVAKFLLINAEKIGKAIPDLMEFDPDRLLLKKDINAIPLWPIQDVLHTGVVTPDMNLYGWDREEVFKFLREFGEFSCVPFIPDWSVADGGETPTLKDSPAEMLGIQSETIDRLKRAIEEFPNEYPHYRSRSPKLNLDIRPWLLRKKFINGVVDGREAMIFGRVISEHFKLKDDTLR